MTTGNSLLISVIGGSGFIGRRVVQELAANGHRLRIAVRRPDLAGHLQPLGAVGQIVPVQANVRFGTSLANAVQGADVVINLAGIFENSGAQSLNAVNVTGAGNVAQAAKEAGVKRLIHFSALGIRDGVQGSFAQSKWHGEMAVRDAFPKAEIVRCAPVFGSDDRYVNAIARAARMMFWLPLFGMGKAKVQPVFVDDVARGINGLCSGEPKPGSFVFAGPQIMTQKQVTEYVLDEIGRKRLLIPIPNFFSGPLSSLFGLMPGAWFTPNFSAYLMNDLVVAANDRTLGDLGVTPDPLSAHGSAYLYRYKKTGQFAETGDSTI